jgi:hypothetical protein
MFARGNERLVKAIPMVAVVGLLSACASAAPIADPPKASVKATSLVRIHGFVSRPCRLDDVGSPSGVRLVFKTEHGVLLGKATTGAAHFATRDDGGCAERAPYAITLPRLSAYVVRDPLHFRDLIATLDQLIGAGFRWDFRY